MGFLRIRIDNAYGEIVGWYVGVAAGNALGISPNKQDAYVVDNHTEAEATAKLLTVQHELVSNHCFARVIEDPC